MALPQVQQFIRVDGRRDIGEQAQFKVRFDLLSQGGWGAEKGKDQVARVGGSAGLTLG